MREYRVRYGNYAGTHYIYESRIEFQKEYPNIQIKKWPMDNPFEMGDWIEAEDGYILQLLSTTRPFLKDDIRSNRKTVFYHFCNSSVLYKRRSDGTEYWRTFFGMYSGGARNMAKNPLDIKGKLQTKLFVQLVLSGVSLYKAFNTAFKKNNVKKLVTNSMLIRKIAEILGDPIVMEEFKNQLGPFQRQFNQELDDEQMAKILADMIKKPAKKGSKDHLEAWKLGANIKGLTGNQMQLPSKDETKTLPISEEAEYTLIPNIEKPEKN